MSKFDFDAMEKASKDAEKNVKDGNNNYFSINKNMTDQTVTVRFLPPTERMNGQAFIVEQGYWINGVRFVSPATFGEEDPLKPILAQLRKEKDPEIMAILNDYKMFGSNPQYMFPALILEIEEDRKGNITSLEIVDNEMKIFLAKKSVKDKVFDLLTSRRGRIKGADYGIFDMELGKNIDVTRTGEGLKTQYKVEDWPESLDITEYLPEEFEQMCIMKHLEEKAVSSETIVAYFEELVYGTEVPEHLKLSSKSDEDEDEKEAPKKYLGRKRKSIMDKIGN